MHLLGRSQAETGSPPRGRGRHLLTSRNAEPIYPITSLSLASVLTSPAPSWTHWRLTGFIGTTDQRHTVEVDRLPIMSMNPEVQTLITASAEHHQGPAILDELKDLVPKVVPDSRRDTAAEDARCNLEQPSGQVPTQPNGTGRQDDNYQGTSSWFCPAGTALRGSQSSTTSTRKSWSLSPSDPRRL